MPVGSVAAHDTSLVATMKAPAHKRLKLTAAGCCRAGGRARIGAWEDHPRLQLSGHPFGGGPHTVAQHWASPRESAEFPTRVKEALAMCAMGRCVVGSIASDTLARKDPP